MIPSNSFSSKIKRFFLMIFVLPLLMLGMQACSTPAAPTPDYGQKDTYPIDPVLKDFYQELDGENLLGAALSPLLEIEGDLCQYTVNALICFDPQATGIAPFFLKSLGAKMGISEAPAESDHDGNAVRINGYVIYEAILPLYNHFDGLLYAGKPITNAFYNKTTGRIEQYFENLGFYADSEKPGPDSGLIPYGYIACSAECPKQIEGAIPPANLPRDNPLADMVVSVEFLGGESIFGSRLTDLLVAPDGNLEIVYENAVFYATPDQPRRILLRELPKLLEMPVMPPGPEKYGSEEGMHFLAVEGDTGYHLPLVFERFLESHGGIALAGQPIGDPVYFEGSTLPRQCFRHICLEYNPKAAEGQQVSLVALGKQYLETDIEWQAYPPLGGLGAALQGSYPAARLLSFQLSEQHPQVRRSQAQIIEIFAFDRETFHPAANIGATLTVTLPDGSQAEYEFTPTNAKGKSQIEIPAIQNVQNGTLISYQVCIDQQTICKTEAYIIWGD